MRRVIASFGILAFLAFAASSQAPIAAESACTTIKSGMLLYQPGSFLAGQPITTGVNPYGYNYQAHLFNGTYFNSYANSDGLPPYDGDDATYLAANPTASNHWAWPYREVELSMKWNDAWLSNQDCDGDLKLDRYFGFSSYIGSGAWTTNHMKGTYVVVDDKDYHWTAFTKIVAAPGDATSVGGMWLAADSTTIGPVIWSEFAVLQDVYNDPGAGFHGVQYLGAYSAGFGRFGPRGN